MRIDATYGSLGLANVGPALIWTSQGYYSISALFWVASAYFFAVAIRRHPAAAQRGRARYTPVKGETMAEPTAGSLGSPIATKADVAATLAELKSDVLMWAVGINLMTCSLMIAVLVPALKR